MENKKKFDLKGILADLCFLIGTMVLGYVNFFVYGQYTGMVEAGVISADAHRVFVAGTFIIVAFLYYNITKLVLSYRKSTGWLFWLTMFTAFLSAVLAVLFTVYGIGSEITYAFVLLSMELYPFFVPVIAFLYYFWNYVKKLFDRKPDRLR
ncbi:MAG: hypothetical protein IKB62_08425 [Oscillospiraceae bacterium]|nr:hypothetical protein [Oscillospiraceae bacterium]